VRPPKRPPSTRRARSRRCVPPWPRCARPRRGARGSRSRLRARRRSW